MSVYTPLRVNPNDYDDMSIGENIVTSIIFIVLGFIVWTMIWGMFLQFFGVDYMAGGIIFTLVFCVFPVAIT